MKKEGEKVSGIGSGVTFAKKCAELSSNITQFEGDLTVNACIKHAKKGG